MMVRPGFLSIVQLSDKAQKRQLLMTNMSIYMR